MWTPFKKKNKMRCIFVNMFCGARNTWHELFRMKSFGTLCFMLHVHFRVAQSVQKKMFPESDVQFKAKVWGFTLFQSISFLWVWHSHEIYVTTPPQTVVGGRVCPLIFFVFAPPSFLVSLPYANTGIRSKNVKHEWNQRCEICQWTRCEAQSYVWCAVVKTSRFPLDCQSGKTNAWDHSFISCHVCSVFSRGRERVSSCGLWCFWGWC